MRVRLNNAFCDNDSAYIPETENTYSTDTKNNISEIWAYLTIYGAAHDRHRMTVDIGEQKTSFIDIGELCTLETRESLTQKYRTLHIDETGFYIGKYKTSL